MALADEIFDIGAILYGIATENAADAEMKAGARAADLRIVLY